MESDMRTLSQVYYDDPLLDLGSSQYNAIAKSYGLYAEEDANLPFFYKDVIDNHSDKLIRIFTNFLDEVYVKFEGLRVKPISEFTAEEREEFYFSDSEDTETYDYLMSRLSESPFEFPVDPRMTKLALLKYVEYTKNSSWDLWALCQKFRSDIFRELMTDVGETMYISQGADAALIYTIKEVFDLDHTTVEKYFGGFDT